MPEKATAIIPAAGAGERLGGDTPKQLRLLGDRPVLAWSAAILAASPLVESLVVGASAERRDEVSELLAKWIRGKSVKVIEGGEQRQDTVRCCLAAVETPLVIIHDAARPFVSPGLIEACLKAAAKTGAATAAMRPSDTVKQVRERVGRNLERETLWMIQTPQAFRTGLIIDAHDEAKADGYTGTDDTDLFERLGYQVEIVEGSSSNFKITTAADWEMAEALVRARGIKDD